MSFDPYELLGLPRAATSAAVKTAYRQSVQRAHPDRGGDTAAFIAIVRAFGVLSDPEARKLYDETGIVDEDGVKTFRADVATVLADMFDAAVETAIKTGIKLSSIDVIAQMSTAVKRGLAENKSTLVQAEAGIAALTALHARIRREGEGKNLFAERLVAQIAAKSAEQAAIRRRLLILDTAIVELSSYRSEVELISALEAAD